MCQLVRCICPFAVALADLKAESGQLSDHNKRLRELGDAVQLVRDVIAVNFTAEVSKLTEDVSTYIRMQRVCTVIVFICTCTCSIVHMSYVYPYLYVVQYVYIRMYLCQYT